MLFAVIFGIVFAGLVSWHAVIAWYLKRYILEDDKAHHTMYWTFITGNAIFILAAAAFFLTVSWNEISLAVLRGYLTDLIGNFLP